MPGVLALSVLVAGCASGFSLKKAEIDRDILTGSVPAATGAAGSDEATIRNAVTSADLGALGAGPLSWANRDTGSTGTIDTITEAKEGSDLCRRFRASRTAYDGVQLYAGTACLGDGSWRMTRFEAL